jgi:hypothetical protein
MSGHGLTNIERRSEERISSQAPGRIMHGDKLSLWADCVIRDLSASGAKIELSHLHKLPPRFILLHFSAAIAYEVVLKWRRGDLAGMAFEHRHALDRTTDPRLIPAQQAWQALQTGFSRGS